MDWEMIRKDGSLIDIEASVSPIRISEKRYSGFRGVIRDVTARREWERARARARNATETWWRTA